MRIVFIYVVKEAVADDALDRENGDETVVFRRARLGRQYPMEVAFLMRCLEATTPFIVIMREETVNEPWSPPSRVALAR